MLYKISALAISILLASCGGGATNTDDNTNTGGGSTGGDGGDGTDGGGSGTNSGGDEVYTTYMRYGDLNISRTGSLYYMKIGGEKVPLRIDSQDGETLIFEEKTINGKVFSARGFKGDDVRGWAGTWYEPKNISVTSDYYIAGYQTEPKHVPTERHAYEGSFMIVRPISESTRALEFKMVWQADFAAETFKGHDYPENANVVFDGSIDGNAVTGHVQSVGLGAGTFNGNFFGAEGGEIAGHVQNGNVTGIFYGQENDIFITD